MWRARESIAVCVVCMYVCALCTHVSVCGCVDMFDSVHGIGWGLKSLLLCHAFASVAAMGIVKAVGSGSPT